jgi:signal transduction histidine kinase
MRTLTDTDASGALLKLLNEARLEADDLRLRLERNERILLSTRLIMGHELKRPATAIGGYLDLALEQTDDRTQPDVLDAVTKARRECRLLDELSAFFLQLIKFDGRQAAGRVGRVDTAKCLDDALGRLAERLDVGKRVIVRISPDAARFATNSDALGIILVNVIENALLYSEGSVKIDIERLPDRRGAASADLLKIRVADQGRGIPEESIKRVFKPFVRLDEEASRGTGLGLTLVRSLVELQGGSVFIRSGEKEGTTVHITIPEAQTIDEGGVWS